MAWKKIPPEADYFHCEPGTEYYICEEGLVVEGRFLQDGGANLDKAIWPTVQGSRAYIRVRRKGVDKKFQLVRIFAELFPDLLGGEIQVRTRKGPFALRVESEPREAEAPVRPAAAKPRREKAPRHEHEEVVAEPVDNEDSGGGDEDEDEEAVTSVSDARICKVCNLRKRASEFSPRDDMCMDCYMGRDELLKEIIARRRRKNRSAAPRSAEEHEGRGNSDDSLDSFGRMDFRINLPE
ncbi:conserved hypothetical protein [Solidesulfovibrio fructosivorans JJ]]|uniref:Uncharacterized protein n=1 Tax=Solidesulfovibrio fructosivorans JJ] TaxID=596151 RepID=E1K0K5_SOLFR|nr:hypothetical protein [Solidesulfovibrio fructosivorans]EFL49857.1 conserved hypothetical protein [Solidesulfovibrio fructosivorans JJ]]